MCIGEKKASAKDNLKKGFLWFCTSVQWLSSESISEDEDLLNGMSRFQSSTWLFSATTSSWSPIFFHFWNFKPYFVVGATYEANFNPSGGSFFWSYLRLEIFTSNFVERVVDVVGSSITPFSIWWGFERASFHHEAFFFSWFTFDVTCCNHMTCFKTSLAP